MQPCGDSTEPRNGNFEPQPFNKMIIFLSCVKMHFFYIKWNIPRKCLNNLHKFYITIFTPEHSLLQRSIPSYHPPCHPTLPASPPCPAHHLAWPATAPGPPQHPARHSTLPATPPCWPAFPGSLACLLSHDRVASVATRLCRPRPPAKAVCVWCKSTCNPLQYSTHPI